MRALKAGSDLSIILPLLLFVSVLNPGLSSARDAQNDKPERSIVMAAEFPGIQVPPDENVSMDIIFHNKGKTDENVDVRIADIPQGWTARIKSYRYTVTGLHVPAGSDKTLTFEADPGKDVPPGKYEFRIEGRTPDGKFELEQTIAVEVTTQAEKPDQDLGVKITTSYPEIRGPSDGTFEFSVEVENKLDSDAVFDLLAQGPKGWDINFKPAYESKYITSLRLQPNRSQTLAVEVKPTPNTAAGEYPIDIQVASGEARAAVQLAVVLTGTYDLEVGTASGLLSLDARRGKPANQSFYVKNSGSAANHGIKFMSFKPENWKVEFKPEAIDVIEPGDLKQVEMIITPYEDALVGDYSISVNVEGEKASKIIEFRTTVKASAAWGWIGIGIIVAVIGGLFGIFRWLGRR